MRKQRTRQDGPFFTFWRDEAMSHRVSLLMNLLLRAECGYFRMRSAQGVHLHAARGRFQIRGPIGSDPSPSVGAHGCKCVPRGGLWVASWSGKSEDRVGFPRLKARLVTRWNAEELEPTWGEPPALGWAQRYDPAAL
jgi:hypothetical protein